MKIFISYAHKDEFYKNELLKHLSNLQRKGIIDGWHDRLIKPGEKWNESIKCALYECQVIVCLISADFLASEYIHNTEIKIALERYAKGEVLIIPVIVRPCNWDDSDLGKFQALPKDAKALSTWENMDEGLLSVAQGVKKIIEINLHQTNDPKQSTFKYGKKENPNIIIQNVSNKTIAVNVNGEKKELVKK